MLIVTLARKEFFSMAIHAAGVRKDGGHPYKRLFWVGGRFCPRVGREICALKSDAEHDAYSERCNAGGNNFH
jgi:hypothetical protein